MTAIVLLCEHADEAALEPLRLLRGQARPAESAQALHLVLLDRERDLARSRIAADDAELGADCAVEQRGKIAGRGAGLAPMINSCVSSSLKDFTAASARAMQM